MDSQFHLCATPADLLAAIKTTQDFRCTYLHLRGAGYHTKKKYFSSVLVYSESLAKNRSMVKAPPSTENTRYDVVNDSAMGV